MPVKLKLPYGLRDGQLIHISTATNGLACDCYCPGCGAPLVAKNGEANQKAAHFAHHKSAECSTGLQTALHLAAKDIIARHGHLCLPGATGDFSFTPAFWASFDFEAEPYQYELGYTDGYNGSTYEYNETELGLLSRYHFASQVADVEAVVLEKKTGDIIPDLLVTIGGRQVLVEVAVTHFVDAAKLEKIRNLGLPALEIDLSKVKRELTLPELEDLVVQQATHKKWLFNPALRGKLRERRQRYFEACRREIEQLHAEDLREEARQATRQKWQAELNARLPQERARIAQSKPTFYRNHYWPLSKRLLSGMEPVWHVDGCPKAARRYHGAPYANVAVDCFDCDAFRGFGPDRTQIVCLFNYLKNKEEKAE